MLEKWKKMEIPECTTLISSQKQEAECWEKMAVALHLEVVALRLDIQVSCILKEVGILDYQLACWEEKEVL